MKFAMLALTLGVAAVLSSSSLQAEDKAGWIDLLPDNKLETHWQTKGNWSINEEGVVSLTPRPGESGWTRYDSYLWLDKQYRNFACAFDYKVEPKGNSGFYFHVADRANPVQQGIEVQIYDSHGQDKLTDHTSGGVIPKNPPSAQNAKPAGEWNHFEIICKDDQLTVILNEKVVNEVDLSQGPLASRPKTGYIGFQDHGLPLKLQKMKIRELP